jgi:hypothetical protein
MTAAATALASSGLQVPLPLSVQPTLAALPVKNPGRCTASNSTLLRGRELVRSQRHACSNSRSRSPARGHRSSSVPADTVQCPGVRLNWAALDSYPWGIHMGSSPMNVPYRPERFTGLGDSTCLWVRSMSCTGSAGVSQLECGPCHAVMLGQALYTLETRAQSAPAHIPYQYLTPSSLRMPCVLQTLKKMSRI